MATSTFTVRRAGPGPERFEPGTIADVAIGVRGHLSAGGGSKVTSVGGTTITQLFPLALDPFVGTLLAGDLIVDAAGGTWTVVFAHRRPLIDHWQATVRSVEPVAEGA